MDALDPMDVAVRSVDVLRACTRRRQRNFARQKEKGEVCAREWRTLRSFGNSAPRSPRLRRCCCESCDSPSYARSFGGPRLSIAMAVAAVLLARPPHDHDRHPNRSTLCGQRLQRVVTLAGQNRFQDGPSTLRHGSLRPPHVIYGRSPSRASTESRARGPRTLPNTIRRSQRDRMRPSHRLH